MHRKSLYRNGNKPVQFEDYNIISCANYFVFCLCENIRINMDESYDNLKDTCLNDNKELELSIEKVNIKIRYESGVKRTKNTATGIESVRCTCQNSICYATSSSKIIIMVPIMRTGADASALLEFKEGFKMRFHTRKLDGKEMFLNYSYDAFLYKYQEDILFLDFSSIEKRRSTIVLRNSDKFTLEKCEIVLEILKKNMEGILNSMRRYYRPYFPELDDQTQLNCLLRDLLKTVKSKSDPNAANTWTLYESSYFAVLE